MKYFTLFIILFSFPTVAFSKQLNIDSKIYYKGKKIGSPRILNSVGEKAKIVMKDDKKLREFSLEILARELKGDEVHLKYQLSIREKNHEILNRGDIKINEGHSGKVIIDKGQAEVHFKLSPLEDTTT